VKAASPRCKKYSAHHRYCGAKYGFRRAGNRDDLISAGAAVKQFFATNTKRTSKLTERVQAYGLPIWLPSLIRLLAGRAIGTGKTTNKAVFTKMLCEIFPKPDGASVLNRYLDAQSITS